MEHVRATKRCGALKQGYEGCSGDENSALPPMKRWLGMIYQWHAWVPINSSLLILGICLSIMDFLAEFGRSGSGSEDRMPLVLSSFGISRQLTGFPASHFLMFGDDILSPLAGLWTYELFRVPELSHCPSLGSAVVALFPCTLLKYHNVVDPFNHFPIFSRSYLLTFDHRCLYTRCFRSTCRTALYGFPDVIKCSHVHRFR